MSLITAVLMKKWWPALPVTAFKLNQKTQSYILEKQIINSGSVDIIQNESLASEIINNSSLARWLTIRHRALFEKTKIGPSPEMRKVADTGEVGPPGEREHHFRPPICSLTRTSTFPTQTEAQKHNSGFICLIKT